MSGLELVNAFGGLIFGVIASAGLIVTLTFYFIRKFNQIEKKFDAIEKKFDDVNERFNAMEKAIDERFNGVERELAEIKELLKSSRRSRPNRVI